MRTINQYSHIPFVHVKLMNLLARESFAWRLRHTIGSELNYWLIERFKDAEEYGEFTDNDFSRWFPVEGLFLWIKKSGGLAATDLQNDDGSYSDDSGTSLPSTVSPSISGIEQLAAYGLWLIDNEMNCCGPSTEEDWDDNRINPQGWTETEVVNHKAECLLLAYQALSYAQRLQNGTDLTSVESENLTRIDFSELGRSGAHVRHKPTRALKKWAIDQFINGKAAGAWKTGKEAADNEELRAKVIAYGRTIGITLKSGNAARTLKDWFKEASSD